MIPRAFRYEVAESVPHAVALLAEPGAVVLAGGQSLLPLMNRRILSPPVVVDIGRLDGLRDLTLRDGRLSFGALVLHTELATDAAVAARCPLLAKAAALVADPQVRHRGTIGGSLCFADPAGDLPTAVAALEARMRVEGPNGVREIAAANFFAGRRQTALLPGELLTHVHVDLPAAPPAAVYLKHTLRAQAWAEIAVAAVGPPSEARVAVANLSETPLRARHVEGAFRAGAEPASAGRKLADDAPEQTGERLSYAAVLVSRSLAELAT
jgi:aerobic carbon-monoxide dehydrogenase medium subunit